MLRIEGLTVQFGGVRPLDDVSLSFESGIHGLIGPNGAGKTTLLNVISGFIRPAKGDLLHGEQSLLRLAPHRRARWGLRRTFQQEQTVHNLSVVENLDVAAEQTSGHAGHSSAEVIEFLALDAAREEELGVASTRIRRLTELGRTLVGKPRVILLDEPASGLDESETSDLSNRIAMIPERFGCDVVLIDHDMSLIRQVCASLSVLDFGRVVAAGPTNEVLESPAVKLAYLGTEEVS